MSAVQNGSSCGRAEDGGRLQPTDVAVFVAQQKKWLDTERQEEVNESVQSR